MGKHKKKDKDVNGEGINVKNGAEEHTTPRSNMEDNVPEKRLKKKKKRDRENCEPEISLQDDTALEEPECKKVKLDQGLNTDNTEGESNQIKHKKKKKKKAKDSKDSNSDTELTGETSVASIDNCDTEIQRKKHKKKKSKEEKVEINAYELIESVDLPKKKHKKKKSEKTEACSTLECHDNFVKEKSKEDVKSTENGSCDSPHKKKKKNKEKTEIGSQSNTPENSSLENLDETKKDKTLTNVVDKTKPMPIKCQWETNAFEDDTKQNKFLRLLGGFKKGADAGGIQQKMFSSKKTANTGIFNTPKFGGTVAMNKSQQETYKKNMESDYNSAMSMHLNRGIGLGFQNPQPAKKFSIDTQNSKSVKFEDSD